MDTPDRRHRLTGASSSNVGEAMRHSPSLSCRYIFRAVLLAMTSWACTGVMGVPPLLRDVQAATAKTGAYLPATRENYLKLADETEAMLHKDVLEVWFPRTVDNENGGFRSNFARDWLPKGGP